MRMKTSFLTRCLAMALALVLLLSSANLGVALQAFAAENEQITLSAGELVADNYDLPEAQKALLRSGMLIGDSYTYTVPSNDDDLITVDTKAAQITAKSYEGWTPVKAYIIKDGETVQTVALEGGKGTYDAAVGNAFSVLVDYVLKQEVPAETQKTLLDTAGYLKQGIAFTDSVDEQKGNLAILEEAMPQLVDFAENGYTVGSITVFLSDECKEAVQALNAQMTNNGGKLNLSVMCDAYTAGSKTAYMLSKGADMKVEAAVTAKLVRTINEYLINLLNSIKTFGMGTEEQIQKLELLISITGNLSSGLYAAVDTEWDAPSTEMFNGSVDYTRLDSLVAALGQTASPEVVNPLTVKTTSLQCNLSMKNVTVSVVLKTVEDKDDSANLTVKDSRQVVLTLADNTTAEEIKKAAAANGLEGIAKTEWTEQGIFDKDHFQVEESALPDALVEDIAYTITYSPKEYTVTASYAEAAQVPYGYRMTLPVHEDETKAYDYEVNGEAHAQGDVIVIVGDTEITRKSGKAYTATDLYTVIADNYGDELAKAILKSGALKNNMKISVRKPDPTDAESLVVLEDGILTVADSYAADYESLNWTPYSYGANGDENTFMENSVSWSGKEVKVKYVLRLMNVSETKVGEILALAKTLKTEADGQKKTLDRLNGYYDTMAGLNKTKMSALKGIVADADYTSIEGVDTEADNKAMQEYFTGIVAGIMAENMDDGVQLNIYNMLTAYKDANGGLKYYYRNSEAVRGEIDSLRTKLSAMLADSTKEAALKLVVDLAGFPEYAEKIANLSTVLDEVKRDLTAPNAAIDVTSAKLSTLTEALETSGQVTTKTAGVPYLVSDALTALDQSQVNVQVIVNVGAYSAAFTTDSFDKGTTLSQAAVDALMAQVNAFVAEKVGADKAPHYAAAADPVNLNSLVGTQISTKVSTYYTYSPKTYIVKFDGFDGEADQTITVEEPEVTLPKHPTEGWVYKYTIGEKTGITSDTYKFSVDELNTLFSYGSLTVTREEVNLAAERLEATLDKLNQNAKEGNSYELVKEGDKITGIVANVSGSKNGLMSFATDLVNCGYTYVGLNGQPFLYLNEEDNLEVSLQALIDAVLSDNEFGSQTLIDLGANKGGKVVTTSLQLGSTQADNTSSTFARAARTGSSVKLDYSDLTFVLKLNSVPGKAVTVSKGLDKIKNYMTFQSKDGELEIKLNLPEKVYEVYLTALLATGDVDKSDMNAINSKIAYQFLYDYLDVVISDDGITSATFSNTLEMLGKPKDLTGYEDYYQLVRKALKSADIDVNADSFDISAEARGKAILDVVESFGFDLSEYQTYLNMVKELKDDGKVYAKATAVLVNTDKHFEAALIDLNAAGKLNKFDYTDDLPARCASIADKAAVILLDDVDGNLVFNGATVLDLNGKTLNGSIPASGPLFIFDSTMATTGCGTVTGNVTGGNINIVGGKFSGCNVTSFLNDGYEQVSGIVQNKAYTIESDGTNVTFVLNTDAIRDGENLSLKTLAADIAVDLALNYFTAAAVSVDGNSIYAANFDDLIGLWKSSTTKSDLANMVLDCLGTGINPFINEVIADLIDFAAIEEALKSGKPVAAYNVSTAAWAVDLQHVTDGDYLSVGIKANPEKGKSFSAALIVNGKYAPKAAELAGELAKIVVADNTYATVNFDKPTYSNKTLSVSGTAEGCLDIDLSRNKDYQTILAVILAYGNEEKADELVAAIGKPADLQRIFNTMTVKEVFDALKALSRNVTFGQMANKVGAGNIGDADKLEKIFHLYLCAAGKVLEELDITGYTDKTMGQLRRSCGRYVLEGAPRKTADITRRGYTVSMAGTVEKVTLAVNIFGSGLLGDADDDGDVDYDDAILIAQYDIDLVDENQINLCVCDVDGDGDVDLDDAILVAQYDIGCFDKFPVELK